MTTISISRINLNEPKVTASALYRTSLPLALNSGAVRGRPSRSKPGCIVSSSPRTGEPYRQPTIGSSAEGEVMPSTRGRGGIGIRGHRSYSYALSSYTTR